MAGESSLSKRLQDRLPVDFYHRIENQIALGTPDVAYCNKGHGGWMELKHVSDYPKRIATPIRFKRFTTEQVAVIEDFGKGQHFSWVVVQVAADHWIFHWTEARELQATRPRPWWEARCRGYWKGRLNYDQLANIL